MKYIVILLSLFWFQEAQSQQFWLRGRVLDSANGQPMSKASVFCQNTSLGTVTNLEGLFALELPNGGYDLIISFTGYEKKIIRISPDDAGRSIEVVLAQQDKSLQEVAVVGSTAIPDGWSRYGSFFLDQFIGTSPNAAQCTLENPDALKFYYSKKKNRLKVMATAPILVRNQALGYRIQYQLDSFAYEYETQVATLTGNPLFEPLTGTEVEMKVWNQHRQIAYQGSRMHFMKSWYQQRLAEEGFRIEKVTNDASFETENLDQPYDSSIFVPGDNQTVEILLTGKIRVKYDKEKPHPDYVKLYKLPAQIRVQMSVLQISESFVIEQNGYFFEQSALTNAGYWSWEKVADLMPYEWRPSGL
jgi:hypothetical protein